jgi:chloramphenicol 3-O-phosphotransferase
LTRRKGGVDDDDRVENSAVGFDATSRKSSSRESGQDCEVVYQTARWWCVGWEVLELEVRKRRKKKVEPERRGGGLEGNI